MGVKTRRKPATKAGKREIFGKMVVVKAKPAKTVVIFFFPTQRSRRSSSDRSADSELGMLAEWPVRHRGGRHGTDSELAAPAELLGRRRGEHYGAASARKK